MLEMRNDPEENKSSKVDYDHKFNGEYAFWLV